MKAPRNPPPVRLALIGTGGMGGVHAQAFNQDPRCRIVAAVDVERSRAEKFCRDHGIPEVFQDAKEMLAKVSCDAVSIVTPDAFHAPISLQCLRAGKHVLCEKPLALNHADTVKMVAAARRAGTVNAVNFTYRNWAAIHGVASLVRGGGIGKVRHLEASYLQCWLASAVWGDWRTKPSFLWRLSCRHGSKGALGDIGVHLVDFATYPTGQISRVYCRLRAFPKAPRNRVGPYVLDANDSAVMTVEFRNGALGTLHTTRWAAGTANRIYLKISGTLGAVEIDSDRSTDTFKLCAGKDLDKAVWRDIATPAVPTNFQRFITAIQARRPAEPDFARGSEVQKVLDACFESDRRGRAVDV